MCFAKGVVRGIPSTTLFLSVSSLMVDVVMSVPWITIITTSIHINYNCHVVFSMTHSRYSPTRQKPLWCRERGAVGGLGARGGYSVQNKQL